MGVYTLHLSDSEFWHLTLAQFDALLRRYIEEQKKLDGRAALICTVLANINRNPKKRSKAFTVEDFMPKYEKERKVKSAEEMLETVKLWDKVLRGDERKK